MAIVSRPPPAEPRFRVVAWGTYDLGKPRVRILLRGLREHGVDVIECHRDVWGGVEDKSQISGWREILRLGLNWFAAYPTLVYRYLRLPAHDAVLIPYLGQLDILVLWPFAKLRRTPLLWDAFLSLYNTVVEDRRLLSKRHPLAILLFAWEWLACRAADAVLLDTNAHGRYFIDTFGLAASKVHRVFVGAESEHFHPGGSRLRSTPKNASFLVLFYGQFIPLHGIEIVVEAAKLSENEGIRWRLIGTGQEAARIRGVIASLAPSNIEWLSWVPYQALPSQIQEADVCLGIFGTTAKAARVIPNKVYQIIASGKPLITSDSPAAREILVPGPAIVLVRNGDPTALAEAVRHMRDRANDTSMLNPHAQLRAKIEPKAVVAPLLRLLSELTGRPLGSARS